ncbi:MAG: FAD-dependent thymidylate synthase [Acidiferrobacterales bacterium]
MPSCKLISVTKPALLPGMCRMTAEELLVYVARVSSPSNQTNLETSPKLLKYLIEHKHWSPFEMGSMTVEIITSRAIAAQILRHRSFSFQEFSQRYAEVKGNAFVCYPGRRQAEKNRQSSVDDLPEEIKRWFEVAQGEVWAVAYQLYAQAIKKGIAKECARFLLPLNTETTLYMSGTIRSWIHYLQIRTEEGVQKEHRDLAIEIRDIFSRLFPATSTALGWIESPILATPTENTCPSSSEQKTKTVPRRTAGPSRRRSR